MATKSGGRKGRVVLVLVAVVLVACTWYWFSKDDESDQPVYQTTSATRGDLTQVVTANGQLNPVINVQVGSQISGNIQRLFADYNSQVKSNQVVAQLDPSINQAVVLQSKADLSNAKAGLELQQVETRRSEALFKDRLISQSDYDRAVASLHQAEAQVQLKEAALQRAQVDLSHCTIYAPVDGIVISRSVDVGQTVAASMNAPTLFVIANDLTKMQIDANVSEADVGTVEEGQMAKFTVDAFPDRTFNGKVTQIRNSPITVQNVVTYDTVIEVNNPDLKLKPGMTATVSIITAQRTNVLRVANAALRFRPPEPATNQTFLARWLGKAGFGGESKPAATNAASATVAGAGGTNAAAGATNANAASATALAGGESPEALLSRMRQMRERGEEPPPELRARIRELFQSGALQRGGGGGGGFGGGGGGGALGSRPRTSQSSSRTVYLLGTNAPANHATGPTLQPLRVKVGITDGTYTEIMDGLKEGDGVVTSVRLPASQQSAAAPGGSSPFGGGMRRF